MKKDIEILQSIVITHEGEDYCKVEVNGIEYEVSKGVARHISDTLGTLHELIDYTAI